MFLTIPCYNETLITISKLVQEILSIRFLPIKNQTKLNELLKPIDLNNNNNNNNNKTKDLIQKVKIKKANSLQSFDLETFLNKTADLSKISDEFLDYFFVYVRYTLDHLRTKLYSKLKFYKILVNMNPK
jgi:hypothetical protein